MTQDERVQLLKNCQVSRVQKDPEWARPVELAVQGELIASLTNYLAASLSEHIGPKEFAPYLVRLRTFIENEPLMPREEETKEGG